MNSADLKDATSVYSADNILIGVGNTVSYSHPQRGLQVDRMVVNRLGTEVEVIIGSHEERRLYEWVKLVDIIAINGKPVKVEEPEYSEKRQALERRIMLAERRIENAKSALVNAAVEIAKDEAALAELTAERANLA